MNQIIDDLIKKIKLSKISVLKLSKQIDIPAYRIYKWIDKKAQPKHDDVMKIEKWLNNGRAEIISEKSVVDNSLIQALRDQIKTLEKHNEFLQELLLK
jgi:ethanolamine utilization protein EutP (predicted NTPase)